MIETTEFSYYSHLPGDLILVAKAKFGDSESSRQIFKLLADSLTAIRPRSKALEAYFIDKTEELKRFPDSSPSSILRFNRKEGKPGRGVQESLEIAMAVQDTMRLEGIDVKNAAIRVELQERFKQLNGDLLGNQSIEGIYRKYKSLLVEEPPAEVLVPPEPKQGVFIAYSSQQAVKNAEEQGGEAVKNVLYMIADAFEGKWALTAPLTDYFVKKTYEMIDFPLSDPSTIWHWKGTSGAPKSDIFKEFDIARAVDEVMASENVSARKASAIVASWEQFMDLRGKKPLTESGIERIYGKWGKAIDQTEQFNRDVRLGIE
jgi:hypothetical protein